ncbi:flagellar basal body L-ring protein FlgH [Natronospora cellulosivora (SeqCode)]
MKYKSTILLLMIVFVLFFITVYTVSIEASSLWNDESANIYQAKQRSFEVGDIVTVIIEETSAASHSANTSLSQESRIDGGAGTGLLDFLRSLGLSYSDQDRADGQTQRSGQLSADITVQLVESFDNGNFKISGTKSVKLNDEEHIISLSGIIRADDIDEDNYISSHKIADAMIEFEGQGVVSAKQRPNIFQRLLNWIF